MRVRDRPINEPAVFDPAWPRYSSQPFPSYRYVPGLNAHPRRDPSGHSRHAPEPRAADWQPEDWRELEPWLFGVDLFNYAYWWESHEQHEALWLAAGRTSLHARFVRGVIRVAAGCLNRHLGKEPTAILQARAGLTAMEDVAHGVGEPYMGVRVEKFVAAARTWLADQTNRPPLIALEAS